MFKKYLHMIDPIDSNDDDAGDHSMKEMEKKITGVICDKMKIIGDQHQNTLDNIKHGIKDTSTNHEQINKSISEMKTEILREVRRSLTTSGRRAYSLISKSPFIRE